MDTDDADTVPKATHLKRLKAKQDAIEALESQLSELRDKLQSMPDHGKLERRLQRTEAERDALRAEFDSYKADTETRSVILAAGITDPEDIELVRWRYGKLPEDKRPSLSDYLGETAKEDRHLRHLFEGPPKPADKPEGATDTGREARGTPEPDAGPLGRLATRKGQGLPNGNKGTKGAAPKPGGPLTLEDIANMPVEERLKPENRALIAQVLQQSR